MLVALIGISQAVWADDGVSITITNDSSDSVIVTVYDLNTTPRRTVVNSQRIDSFASVLISVASGDDGLGAVTWKARSPDSLNPRCGRGEKRSLDDDDVVNVHADSECGPTKR